MRKTVKVFVFFLVVTGVLASFKVNDLARANMFYNPHILSETDTTGCGVCHFAHYGVGAPLLSSGNGEKDLCYSCHDGSGSNYDIKSIFGELEGGGSSYPSYHPVPTGQMNCSSCHNPHSEAPSGFGIMSGPAGLSLQTKTCGECHGEGSELIGGDIATPIMGTPHDVNIPAPLSGSGNKCIGCHKPHASQFRPLLQETIYDGSGNPYSITGNNNTVCFGCHTNGVANYKGRTVYDQSKHGSTSVSQIAASTYPGTTYQAGQCLNCHEPHGKTGNLKYTRDAGNDICVKCHETQPANYSYRGITVYNNTPHAQAGGPTRTKNLYLANSQSFAVWQGLQSQTPGNPGQPVVNISPLVVQDSSYLITDLAVLQNDSNTQMYKFKLAEPLDRILKLSVKWRGYGEPTPGHPTSLAAWNLTLNSGSGGWETISSQQLGTEGTIEFVRTNAAEYVNEQGEVYLLASARHDGTPPVITNISEYLVPSTTTIRISWTTNEPAKSWVDYGTTTNYGTTLSNAQFRTSHSFDLPNLQSGVMYYYRIRTEDALGNQSSVTRTFSFVTPPTAPTLIDQSNISYTETPVYVNLRWNRVNDPNPIQYKVQVTMWNTSFSTIYTESPWLNDNGQSVQSWTASLYDEGTYYWRVKARYTNYPAAESTSAVRSFSMTYSCPILYTWNGEKFVYITDIVAGSNLGLETVPGRYLPPSPAEQVVIPGSMLAEENGFYTIKIKNELNEIDYIDNLHLQAVDHPVGTSVGLNDLSRYILPYRLYTYNENVQPVKKATYYGNPTYSRENPTGPEDITDLVSKVDNWHALGTLGDDSQFTFDLGDLRDAEEIKLIVVGWTHFMNEAERDERIEKGKQGIKRADDLVEVLQPDGTWRSERIKHIAGHTKTNVIDLTGKFAPGTEEFIVRLRGLYRPRIDFVGVDTTPQASITLTDLELTSAHLEYGGLVERELYPSPYYNYYSKTDKQLHHAGRFTRFGDVLPLVAEIDDKLVVMDSGDELTVRFRALPQPEPGMTRSFLLKPYAYYKELSSATVEPMPFRGMDWSKYPGSLGEYPQELQDYVEEWNTRVKTTSGPVSQGAGLFDSLKLFVARLYNFVNNFTQRVFLAKAKVGAQPAETPEPQQMAYELHYSLNTNYIEMEVESSVVVTDAGYCTNCHAVHGNNTAPKQLSAAGGALCFGNGFGCHSDPANSFTGSMSMANFTSAAGYSSRHSIDPAEQALRGTKVECTSCHNPHTNTNVNKTIDPFNRNLFLNQWVDRGISDYLGADGSVYLLARAKHDGYPPVISNINHTVNFAQSSAQVTWSTNERSTREVQYIVVPKNYAGTVPDAVYNQIVTVGNSNLFSSPHSLTLSGLSSDYEYRYRIKAVDALGNIGYSSAVFDRTIRITPPPPAPQNLRNVPATLPSGNYSEPVRLEWDAVTDADGSPMQYWAEYNCTAGQGTSGSSGWLPVGQTFWNTTVSNHDDATYSWRVKARTVYGTEGPYSSYATFTHTGSVSYSCPVLFTWDGEKYAYNTDIVAGSNIGIQTSSGKYIKPTPDEQVVIPGNKLAEKNGRYVIKLKNDLDEIDYIDNLRLLSVEHPAGTKIALNDFVRQKEPFKVYTYSENVRPVTRAGYFQNPTYSEGEPYGPIDITDQVSRLDNVHAIGALGDDNQFTFDLGDLRDAEEIRLVVVGWTDFMNETERVERVEKGNRGIFRAADLLEVLLPDGTWWSEPIRHIPGHTKTAVIDLTGKFPEGTEEFVVRLRGLYRPYLDFVGVDTTPQAQLQITELELSGATLEYGGLSYRTKYPSPDYDYYQQMDVTIKHEGKFTRFGDVLPLVAEIDDKLVVMDTGDELTVTFGALPPPQPDKERSFVLVPWAYYKELSAATVDPMPFRNMDMSKFPASLGEYPAHLQQYVEEWNTRIHSVYPQKLSLFNRVKSFFSMPVRWLQAFISGFMSRTDKMAVQVVPVDTTKERSPDTRQEDPLQEHYSLNTNFASVMVGTTSTIRQYYPNSTGSAAWANNVLPTFGSPGIPATETEKNNASTPGSSVWSTDLAGAGEFNFQMFKFAVQEPISSITKLTVSWTGYGEPTPGFDTWVYLWNFRTGLWDQLATGNWSAPRNVNFFVNKDNSAYCNKCHNNNPPQGVLMGTPRPANTATSAINDFHGDFPGSKGKLRPPYAVGTRRLACDDCHDPHGSSNVYHLRETVNFIPGITVTNINGVGARSFCGACHTGSLINDWHASCLECHSDYFMTYVSHEPIPYLTESLLSNCFSCHGHNRSFVESNCGNCHGTDFDHLYTKTF